MIRDFVAEVSDQRQCVRFLDDNGVFGILQYEKLISRRGRAPRWPLIRTRIFSSKSSAVAAFLVALASLGDAPATADALPSTPSFPPLVAVYPASLIEES